MALYHKSCRRCGGLYDTLDPWVANCPSCRIIEATEQVAEENRMYREEQERKQRLARMREYGYDPEDDRPVVVYNVVDFDEQREFIKNSNIIVKLGFYSFFVYRFFKYAVKCLGMLALITVGLVLIISIIEASLGI